MIKHLAIACVLIGLTALPAAAQGRGKGNKGRIPPGHMPSAGECRVWYDGVPPGRQPRPTSCAEAERQAAQSRGSARVIYGEDRRDGRVSRGESGGGGGIFERGGRDDGRRGDDRARTDRRRPTGEAREPRGRAIPRTGDRSGARTGSAAYDNGYRDGFVKGREDALDRDSFDPDRHSWYRSADRGYSSRHGSRDAYRADYRAGFADAYEQAYRDAQATGSRSRTRRLPF